MTNILVVIIAGLLLVIATMAYYISFHRRRSASIIFGLMEELTSANSLSGDCQISYKKSETGRARNFAFSFNDLEGLRKGLEDRKQVTEQPEKIILFIDPKTIL